MANKKLAFNLSCNIKTTQIACDFANDNSNYVQIIFN